MDGLVGLRLALRLLCDGEPTYAAVAARQRHPSPNVVVQSQRDRHIRLMTASGRMG